MIKQAKKPSFIVLIFVLRLAVSHFIIVFLSAEHPGKHVAFILTLVK